MLFGKSQKTKAIVSAIANFSNSTTHIPEPILPEHIRVKQIPMLAMNESYEVYGCQWGDVTFLAYYQSDDDIHVIAYRW